MLQKNNIPLILNSVFKRITAKGCISGMNLSKVYQNQIKKTDSRLFQSPKKCSLIFFFFVFFYKYLLRIECTENEVNNVLFFSKFTLCHKHKETSIWIPNTVSVYAAYRARDEHMQIIVCFLVSMRWWQKHCAEFRLPFGFFHWMNIRVLI